MTTNSNGLTINPSEQISTLILSPPNHLHMLSRVRAFRGLPPLEFDCLACSNKRFDKKSIVLVASASRFERQFSLAFCLKARPFQSNGSFGLTIYRSRDLYIIEPSTNQLLLMIRGSAGLSLLQFDCLACSNKRSKETSIVLGGIRFQIGKVIKPVLFM